MYIYNFLSIFNHLWTFVFKRMLTWINFFSGLIQTCIFHLIQVVLIIIIFQKFWCLMIHGTYFFGFSHLDIIEHIDNDTVVFLFFMESFSRHDVPPWSLVGWAAAYLVPNSINTLHSSEECSTPWIIQVFDSLFDRSTYRLRRFPELPSVVRWVFVKVAYLLWFQMIPVRLASAKVVFW